MHIEMKMEFSEVISLAVLDLHMLYTVPVALLLVANNSAYAYLGLAV